MTAAGTEVGRGTGRSVTRNGYVVRLSPGHPRAGNSGFVMEHILVVEAATGKPLRASADVHHVDRDRANNANTNLVACDSRGYHFLLHVRQRALDACGDPNARMCEICKRYDHQDDIAVRSGSGNGISKARHRSCHKAAAARTRQRRAS